MPDKDGRLTRRDMEGVLASGQSVIYQGRTIDTYADLPSEAELAALSGREVEALNDIDDKISELLAQKELLKQSVSNRAATPAEGAPGSLDAAVNTPNADADADAKAKAKK